MNENFLDMQFAFEVDLEKMEGKYLFCTWESSQDDAERVLVRECKYKHIVTAATRGEEGTLWNVGSPILYKGKAILGLTTSNPETVGADTFTTQLATEKGFICQVWPQFWEDARANKEHIYILAEDYYSLTEDYKEPDVEDEIIFTNSPFDVVTTVNISIYSRAEAERLIQSGFPQNAAVICFDDPPGISCPSSPLDYSGKTDRIYRVAMPDIDRSELQEYNLSYERCFPEADGLAEFIYDAVSDGADIICQCEYGESRSAGCAAAILEYFCQRGISIFADDRYYPNRIIYHKVFDALEKASIPKLKISRICFIKEELIMAGKGFF